MIRNPVHIAAVPALVLCSACAAPDGDYPTLAIRDIERVSGTMLPTETPPADLPEPLTGPESARLEALAANAQAAHDRFLAMVDETARIVAQASGSGPGSESWARAQVALADLQAQRSAAMIALADIDRLYVDAATSGDLTVRVGSVQDSIGALIEAEDARLAALSARLAR